MKARLDEMISRLSDKRLSLADSDLDDDTVLLLAADARIKGVVELDLSSNQIGDRGVIGLAEAPTLKKLKRLILRRNACSLGGLCAIFQSNVFKNQLLTVDYRQNDLSDARANYRLGRPPRRVKKLQDLDVSDCEIGGTMLNLLTHGQAYLMTLHTLKMRGNLIPAADAWSLSGFSNMQAKKLEWLDLADNQLGDEGALYLAKHGRYPNLRRLDLEGNGVTDTEELRALFQERFVHLEAINL